MGKTLRMNKYHLIRDFARANRKNPTKAEAYFWKHARGKQIGGYKFLRQHIIEYRLADAVPNYFIADFYCAELKLVVELDGRIHEAQQEYDAYRTEILEGKGMRVLRFSNREVLANCEMVLEKILEV